MSKTDTAGQPLLSTRDLHKHYYLGGQDLHILRGVNLSVANGQWVAIVGASGSGKSTLLHLLGGLDWPDQGDVEFQRNDVFKQGRRFLDGYRNRSVGFVFQFYHLLPELTAMENVLIGAMIGCGALSWPSQRLAFRHRASQLLDQLGLAERMQHKPAKLSGGERQRVAIARALINEPPLLMADEPTGNLDTDTGQQLLDVLGQLHQAGQTIVMVTHDNRVAQIAQRRLTLEHGQLRQ